MRILLADASPKVLEQAQALLADIGHKVSGASSNRDALNLARETKPDVVFVDLALPESGGITLCEQMARDSELQNVPIVLLVTAGDPLAERLREWLTDHIVISKPLSADSMISAMQSAIAQSSDSFAMVLRRWADRIAAADDKNRAAVLKECLQNLGHDPRVILAGDLSVVSVAELFQMFVLQQQSGSFSVENQDLELEIYFREGKIDYVYPRRVSPNLVLGNIMIAEDLVSADTIFSFLSHRPSGGMFGQQLIEHGIVTRDLVHRALGQQSSELIYELVRMRSGRFSFLRTDQVPAYANEHRLQLSTDRLLLEGLRRADELDMLEARLGNDRAVVRLARPVAGTTLSAHERVVLQLCVGRSLADVVRQSLYSRFETMKAVESLVAHELVSIEKLS